MHDKQKTNSNRQSSVRPASAKTEEILGLRLDKAAEQIYKDEKDQDNRFRWSDKYTSMGRSRFSLKKPIDIIDKVDFGRIIPRQMLQDKERLYSEALQLKLSLNGVIDQNVRLKTRIAQLEKNKDIDSTSQLQHLRTFTSIESKKKDAQQMGFMHKLLNDARNKVETLQRENSSMKRSLKYTRLNELQSENKILNQEIKKMLVHIQEITVTNDSKLYENHMGMLKKQVERLTKINKQLQSKLKKVESQFVTTQQKLKKTEQMIEQKDKKLINELIVLKKKLADSITCQNSLRKQIVECPNRSNHTPILSFSAHILGVSQKKNDQLKMYRNKNLNQQVGIHHAISTNNKNLIVQKWLQQKNINKPAKNGIIKILRKDNLSKQSGLKWKNQEVQKLKPVSTIIEESKIKTQSNKNIQTLNEKSVTNNQDSRNLPVNHDDSKDSINYQDDYQEEEQANKNKSQVQLQNKYEIRITKDNDQLLIDEENSAYLEESHFKQYILKQVTELIRFRLGTQRYTFQNLKEGIINSYKEQFTSNQFVNQIRQQPFYLSEQQAKVFIKGVFGKKLAISSEQLIQKLKRVLGQLEIISQEQEADLQKHITGKFSKGKSEIQNDLQEKKNGTKMIHKDELTKILLKHNFNEKQIKLVIGRLALSSDELNHLNFKSIFHLFSTNGKNQKLNNDYLDQHEQNIDKAQLLHHSFSMKGGETNSVYSENYEEEV